MAIDQEEYDIRHNSSVDRIARAMAFYRASVDFLELLDLEEENGPAQAALKFLQAEAMKIARKEAN